MALLFSFGSFVFVGMMQILNEVLIQKTQTDSRFSRPIQISVFACGLMLPGLLYLVPEEV
jgi:hypothetical protein